MPLHIDVKVNSDLVRRIHIARMTKNGMNPESINEYAVVDEIINPNSFAVKNATETKVPEQWEWDLSDIRFFHRYGDDELSCLMKALVAVQENEKLLQRKRENNGD